MATIFKIDFDISGLDSLRSGLNNISSEFTQRFQRGVNKLNNSSIARIGKTLQSGLKKGLGILSEMVNKAKILYLTLLGAATAAFALTRGQIEERRQSKMWGTDRPTTEAIKYADKQSGFDMSSAISSVAGTDVIDWQGVQATTGVERTGNYFNDTRNLIEVLRDAFKGVKAGDLRVAELGSQYQYALGALGMTAEEMRVLANDNSMWGDWNKYFNEDYKRNKGKDYDTYVKGEQAFNNFLESLKDLAMKLSAMALPKLTEGLNALSKLIDKLGDWFTNHPEVIEGLKSLTAQLGTFASIIGKLTLEGLGVFGNLLKAIVTGDFSVIQEMYRNTKEGKAKLAAVQAEADQKERLKNPEVASLEDYFGSKGYIWSHTKNNFVDKNNNEISSEKYNEIMQKFVFEIKLKNQDGSDVGQAIIQAGQAGAYNYYNNFQ